MKYSQQTLLIVFGILFGSSLGYSQPNYSQPCPPIVNVLGIQKYKKPRGPLNAEVSKKLFMNQYLAENKRWSQQNSFIDYEKAVRTSTRNFVSTLIGGTGGGSMGGMAQWVFNEGSEMRLSKYFSDKYKFNDQEFKATVNAAVKYQYAKSKRLPTAAETVAYLDEVFAKNKHFKSEHYAEFASQKFDSAVADYIDENQDEMQKIKFDVDQNAQLANGNRAEIKRLKKEFDNKWNNEFLRFKEYTTKNINVLTSSMAKLADAQEELTKVTYDQEKRLQYIENSMFQSLPPKEKLAAINSGALGTDSWDAEKKSNAMAMLDRQLLAEDALEFGLKYSAYSQLTLQAITTFDLLPAEDIEKVSEFVSFSNQAVDIKSNIAMGYAGNPMGYVNAASGLMNMIGGGSKGPSAEDQRHSQVMGELKAIRSQLKNMDKKLDNIIEYQRIMFEQLGEFQKQVNCSFENLEDDIRDNKARSLWNTELLKDGILTQYYRDCHATKTSLKRDLKKTSITTYADIEKLYDHSPCSECMEKLELIRSDLNSIKTDDPNSFPMLFFLSDNSVLDFDKKNKHAEKDLDYYKNEYFNPSITLFKSVTLEAGDLLSLQYPPRYVNDQSVVTASLSNEDKIGYENTMAYNNHFINRNKLLYPEMVKFYDSLLIEQDLHLAFFLSHRNQGNRALIQMSDLKKDGFDYGTRTNQTVSLLREFLYLTNAAISQQSLVAGNQNVLTAYSHLFYSQDTNNAKIAIEAIRSNMYLQTNLAVYHIHNNIRYKSNSTYYKSYSSWFNKETKPDSSEVGILNEVLSNPYFSLDAVKVNGQHQLFCKFRSANTSDDMEVLFPAPSPNLIITGQMVYPDILYDLVSLRDKLRQVIQEYEVNQELYEKAIDPNSDFSIEDLNTVYYQYQISNGK